VGGFSPPGKGVRHLSSGRKFLGFCSEFSTVNKHWFWVAQVIVVFNPTTDLFEVLVSQLLNLKLSVGGWILVVMGVEVIKDSLGIVRRNYN
jgi:hypothetical protein